MMQCRCSGSHMVGGSCSCGWFDYNQNNSFSMLFPSSANYDDQPDMYSSYNYASSSSNSPPYSSSSVDCTLSLGTPSTRSSNVVEGGEKRRPSCVSNFCSWKILQPKSHESSSNKSNRGNNGGSYSSGGDALSARRCANCDTTTTPLWRNGPRGPKSLCNACGIRYKKEERRASAAANSDSSGGAAGAWAHHSQNQKIPYFSSPYGTEYSFMEDDQNNYHDSDSGGLSFLSWRLNVADRPGLVHDFTR